MDWTKLFVFLLVALYLAVAGINLATGPESIDEYSLSYWSSRLADNITHPVEALKLDPEADKLFGLVGFLRSGYFVYDTSLPDIAAGKPYNIIPMLHYVPIAVYALIKAALGDWAHFFLHTLALVLALLLPVHFHTRYNKSGEAHLLAALLLATPAFLVNNTYAMTDGIGTLAMSLFCYVVAVSSRRKGQEVSVPGALAAVAASVVFTFYKPIGIVFLPWSVFVLLTQLAPNRRTILTGMGMALCAVVVMIGAKNFYSNYFWAGYNNVLNHYLYKAHYSRTDLIRNLEQEFGLKGTLDVSILNSLKNKTEIMNYVLSQVKAKGVDKAKLERLLAKTKADIERSTAFDNVKMNLNVLYKPLGLACAYPLFLFLLLPVGRDLLKKLRAVPKPRARNIVRSEFTRDFAFVFPCLFMFCFFMAYSQVPFLTYHIKLTTPLVRYVMILAVIFLWYLVMNDLVPSLRRVFVPLLAAQLLVAAAFPQGVPMRIAYRFYSQALGKELHQKFEKNYVILGGYRYDKFFDPERVASYAFLAHQRSMAYDKCMQQYKDTLGDTETVIDRIYSKGHVPVVIYPDYIFPDDATVMNPYQDLRTGKIKTIDMAGHAGFLKAVMPEIYRSIHIAEVLPANEATTP